jgi:hypothetical protein
MVKKLIISMTMLSVVALAIASSGGGGSKKSTKAVSGLSILRSSAGFSLKAGPLNGSLSVPRNNSTRNLIVTYRKGNTIYILPAPPQPSLASNSGSTNLDALKFKMNIGK